MLHLLKNGQFSAVVFEGNWFKLDNGDMVSPAFVGWNSGEYELVLAPAPVEEVSVTVQDDTPPAE